MQLASAYTYNLMEPHCEANIFIKHELCFFSVPQRRWRPLHRHRPLPAVPPQLEAAEPGGLDHPAGHSHHRSGE